MPRDDNILDDRQKVAVLLLEAAFILGQEPVEIVKKHAVEDGTLWMSGAIDSCTAGD